MPDLIESAIAFVRSPFYLDVTPRQLAVLGIALEEGQPLKVREMAATLNLTKPVVTRALDTLESHGLVERRRGKDKRDRLIHPTPAGRAFRSQLQRAMPIQPERPA